MLVVVVAAVGCGSDPAMAPGATVKAVALDNVFTDGKPLRIAVGDTVEFVNDGHNDHDIVGEGSPAWGVDAADFEPGQTYSHTFTKAGVYLYYCSLHGTAAGGMTGIILVGDVGVPHSLANAPTKVTKPSGRVIKVPAEQPTIQKAVDAAGPGDLILVSPGTYHEAVEVPSTKPGITIRGLDRNKVILTGDFTKDNGVKVIKANDVTVENLTVEDYTKNGVFWTGVTGYHGSYLTSYRNGDYGLYSFQSKDGQIDNSYSSGSPDAGVYVGGCNPCNALLNHITSEWNGLGYSGTNSSGNLVIANSIFRYNRAGVVPNSGSYEPYAPERSNTIVGNLVYDNNNGKTPAIDISITAMGNGILIAGGSDNLIERNRVFDHDLGGIVVITYPESADYVWNAKGNIVRDNIVTGSKLGDLSLWYDGAGKTAAGNCFAGNTYTTSRPFHLQQVAPCSGTPVGSLNEGSFDLAKLATNAGKPASVPYDKAATPPIPPQVQMPDAATAPGDPASDVPEKLDIDAIPVPAAPPGS
jgi:plastocyanin